MGENHIIRDVNYLPFPNYLETFITPDYPNINDCFGSFCFIFDDQNRLLLSHLRKRGWDLPGGKRDLQDEEGCHTPHEIMLKCAIRETYEETKVNVKDLIKIGHRLFHHDGKKDEKVGINDKYCVYYFGRVQSLDEFTIESQENGSIDRKFYDINDPDILKMHAVEHHISLFNYIVNNLL